MYKAISFSAIVLLSIGTAYAQGVDNTQTLTPMITPDTSDPNVSTNGSNGTISTTTPTTVVTTPDASDSTYTPGSNDNTISTDTVDTTTTTPGTTTTPVTTDVSTTPSPVTSADDTTNGTVVTTPSTTSTTTTTTASPVAAFSCTGSNPAWNLSISQDLITYSTAKSPAIKIRGVTPRVPMGDLSGMVQAYATKDPSGRSITILVRKNSVGCSSGVPGQTFQYDAFVVFPNMVVTGCCNPV